MTFSELRWTLTAFVGFCGVALLFAGTPNSHWTGVGLLGLALLAKPCACHCVASPQTPPHTEGE